MKRFIIAGTKSGCGKTTVTCAILSALAKRGTNVTAFKCGPDYIDPMFHRQIIGVDSHNLDSFFCGRDTLLYLLDEYGRDRDAAVIEGVMGFYDGVSGSAHEVSELTETPAVIVIDCKGMSDSIGAVMSGFLGFRRNRIAGFIFNRLPEKLIPLAKQLCEQLGTEYFGCLPQNRVTLGSRHLGLVTADEIADIKEKTAYLGELAEQHILIDKLLAIGGTPLPAFTAPRTPHFSGRPVIAVARDRAFSFIYSENIGLLEKMGCTIKYFSPISDTELPEADGLILCGGYPELYMPELSGNISMLADIKRKLGSGMPYIAECGGFMYLHRSYADSSGVKYGLVGAIDAQVYPTDRLQRFGYITMTSADDNLLCGKCGKIRAHEFHYCDSSDCGNSFTAEKSDGRTWLCGHAASSSYAGFPHIYFYSDTGIAERFVKKCCEYGGKNETDQ